ncbi:MAG: hypothetical protein ABEJ94_00270 [Halorientalis sp.]
MALSEVLAANKLQVALASVVVVGAGGAATYVALTGGLLAGDDMLGAVPATADTVMHVDGDITDDETTRALVNEVIDATAANGSYDGPENFAAVLDRMANDSGLSPEGFHGMTAFAAYGDDAPSNYSGTIVASDWSTDAFVAATANGSDYERRTYQGYTVYVVEGDESTAEGRATDRTTADGEFGAGTGAGGIDAEPVDSGPTWIAVLGDGRFVTGTEAAVKDAVDVDRGAAAAIGADLRRAYESSPDGYVRFAGTVPEDADEANLSAANRTAAMVGIPGLDNLQRLRTLLDVESYAGAYYTDASDATVGFEFRLTARNPDTAGDLQALLSGTLTAMEYTVPPNETAALFDDTTITRDGSDVVVTFESTPANVADGYRALLDFAQNMTSPLLGGGYGGGSYTGEYAGSDAGNWSDGDTFGEGADSFGTDDGPYTVERVNESTPTAP